MPDHLPFAIVGAGVVARTLGRLLSERGASVVALASRSRSSAERAAAFIASSVRVVSDAEVPGLATRVLIAVTDGAIESVAQALAGAGMRSGVVLHTSGVRGPAALAPLSAAGVACGVLHPLQSILAPEQGLHSLEGVTFGLAGDAPAVMWAEQIVALLGGRALRIHRDRLSCYHAGAVLAGNAVVAVVDAAVALMKRAGIEEQAALRALEPLARASLDNTFSRGPRAALTGPIARGDVGTVAAHLEALAASAPTVAALYRAASARLLEISEQQGLPESTVRALERLIESPTDGERQ